MEHPRQADQDGQPWEVGDDVGECECQQARCRNRDSQADAARPLALCRQLRFCRWRLADWPNRDRLELRRRRWSDQAFVLMPNSGAMFSFGPSGESAIQPCLAEP